MSFSSAIRRRADSRESSLWTGRSYQSGGSGESFGGRSFISLRAGRLTGKKGLARLIASVVVAMPYALEKLEEACEQQIVQLAGLTGGRGHETEPAARYG